jgi:SagB-type dehydrogenase family enzyme
MNMPEPPGPIANPTGAPEDTSGPDLRGFRDIAVNAWSYHRSTCRWPYNASHTSDDRPETPREFPDVPSIALPPPDGPAADFITLTGQRASCRHFTADPLSLGEVSCLASATYGTTGYADLGAVLLPERPVPSGGGLYPLELYFLMRQGAPIHAGVFHYHPYTHVLEQLRDVALPKPYVQYLFMGQQWFADAAAIAILTAVPRRTARKYGDRGYRYLLLEAGHAAQNLVLAATALGLGTCCGGGFFDDELAGLLHADIETEIPVYAVAIGRPASIDRNAGRNAL